MPAFKPDSSFFRKIAIGAVGTRAVCVHMNRRQHTMVELERGSTDTKLWKDVKRKRVPTVTSCTSSVSRFTVANALVQIQIAVSPKVWLPEDCDLEQIAVFINHPKNRHEIAGGKILSLDEFMKEVKDEVAKEGIMGRKAISEVYPLLRTLQLALNGYYKVL